MRIVFRMGVPFAQIADGSLTRRPSSLSNPFVTKRHTLKKVAKSPIASRGNSRLIDNHVSPMNRTKQKAPSLAVGIFDLHMLTKSP